MTTPATDIINRLIGYAGHDDDCTGRFYKESWDGLVCTCGYSATKADAREFLEGEEDVIQEN